MISYILENISTIIIISSTILLCSYLLKKNNNFISIRTIIKDHFKVFNKDLVAILAIFILPAFASIGITIDYSVNKEIIDNITLILTIFISMLFATLSILSSFNKNQNNNQRIDKEFSVVLKATFNSTIFEILLCLLLLLICFINLFTHLRFSNFFLNLNSFLIYYLTITIILNLLIIIKRIKALFDYSH